MKGRFALPSKTANWSPRVPPNVVLKPVEWLWPKRIAIGKLALIAGEAGLGKSQISIAIAAAVTTGGPFPCGEGNAPLGSVIILSAEDSPEDTVKPRLLAAGADCSRIEIVRAVRSETGSSALNLATDLDLLETKIAAMGDVQLVIIDPISSYLGTKLDSHVNTAIRGVLEPLGEMADRLRVAVVSITHPPKNSGASAINRFIGSIGFVAAARAAFMVTRDPDDDARRLFLPVKNNLAPLGKGLAFRLKQRPVYEAAILGSTIVWENEPVNISADAALRATDEAGKRDGPRQKAETFLKELLANGPVPKQHIKEAADGNELTWATVRRAKDRLGIKPRKAGMDGGWLWELPRRCSPDAEGAHFQKVSTFGKSEHLRETAPPHNGKGNGATDKMPDIPPFLRRPLPKAKDDAPALGPPGDGLEDFK
jgi:putative DNA primase/helicase